MSATSLLGVTTDMKERVNGHVSAPLVGSRVEGVQLFDPFSLSISTEPLHKQRKAAMTQDRLKTHTKLWTCMSMAHTPTNTVSGAVV